MTSRGLAMYFPFLLHARRLCSAATHSQKAYDLVVVGGGIVGLATAREVTLRHPHMRVAVVEKENSLAAHQTGHNSGVIHSGIYYTPGTLKARLCVKGADLTYQYCEKKGIPYKRLGKVIVAVKDEEVPRLRKLFERGQENGVKDLRLIGPEELKEIEPYCQGKMAIHSPNTGIVDFGVVARSYAKDLCDRGGEVITDYEVTDFSTEKSAGSDDLLVGVHSKEKAPLLTSYLITCAGMYSDRIASLSDCNPEPRIVPFRGEYLLLNPEKAHMVRGNIYPVPDPRFPFLGVHFTPRMDGAVWLGPNAIFAFSREGYRFTDFKMHDFKEAIQFKGLHRLIKKYWKFGSMEMLRAAVLATQLKQLQQYIPDITLKDISRGPAGVRAQAMDSQGNLIEDFVFDQGSGLLGSRMLHVRNAPSPAATSGLAIAEMVVDKAEEVFQWSNL